MKEPPRDTSLNKKKNQPEDKKQNNRIHPREVCTKDVNGWTPLHSSCLHENCNHPNSQKYDSYFLHVSRLLSIAPQVASIGNDEGELPLHVAIRSRANPKTIEILLRVHPQAAQKRTKWGKTPLRIYVKIWRYFLQSCYLTKSPSNIPGFSLDILKDLSDDEIKLCNAKRTLILLLEAVIFGTVKQIGMDNDNEDCRNNDKVKCALVSEAIKNDLLDDVYIHLLLDQKNPPDLQIKECKNTPFHNRLLLIAMKFDRNSDLLKKIHHIAPSVISTKDPISGLYPFMLASTLYHDEISSLNVCYELLKLDPTLIYNTVQVVL